MATELAASPKAKPKDKPEVKDKNAQVPKAKPKLKNLDLDLDKLINLEKESVQVERTVERLKGHQDKARQEGDGVTSQGLEPELRLAHFKHINMFTDQQKHGHLVDRKIDQLMNSGQRDKAVEYHRALADEYRKLHHWATQSHRLTKSPVFSKARHAFHQKAQQHEQQSIDPNRAKR